GPCGGAGDDLQRTVEDHDRHGHVLDHAPDQPRAADAQGLALHFRADVAAETDDLCDDAVLDLHVADGLENLERIVDAAPADKAEAALMRDGLADHLDQSLAVSGH